MAEDLHLAEEAGHYEEGLCAAAKEHSIDIVAGSIVERYTQRNDNLYNTCVSARRSRAERLAQPWQRLLRVGQGRGAPSLPQTQPVASVCPLSCLPNLTEAACSARKCLARPCPPTRVSDERRTT
jgi:hypothetical protein